MWGSSGVQFRKSDTKYNVKLTFSLINLKFSSEAYNVYLNLGVVAMTTLIKDLRIVLTNTMKLQKNVD